MLIMEDGAFTPNAMGTLSDTSVDFNLMDELLYDGFWLETTTTDGSNFWQPGPTTPTNLNPASFTFPSSEFDIVSSSLNNTNPQEENKLNIFGQPSINLQMEAFSGSQSQNQEPAVLPVSLNQSGNVAVEETEMNRRLWIAPNRNPIRTISVKNKLVQAINLLQESFRDKDVLIQIWVPVKRGGRRVLTTTNQPFSLNPGCKNLADYRDVSEHYQFAADKDSKDFVGLPGRVFLKKLPEWTPDVRFFKSEEYPRMDHAQRYDVRGSLALPVFEQGSGKCLGVVEIITTSQKLNYRPELENVCKALEAVELKSSTLMIPPNIEVSNESYQTVVSEIRYVLKCVCEMHKLPLAQTWTPCIQEGKGGCRHSDENYSRCISTLDYACYVGDQGVFGFQEACSEHHLLRGEGIAGKAFLTNQPCFAEDITAFSKTEYPLAHHARVFNLGAAVAIRLRSTYTGKADFVLEFFLPLDCKDGENQRLMLDSLSSVIQQTCQSLRVVTDQELEQEMSDREISRRTEEKKVTSPCKENSRDSSSWIMDMMGPQNKGKGIVVSMGQQKEEQEEEFKVTTNQWNPGLQEFTDNDKLQHDYISEGSGRSGGSFFLGNSHTLGAKTNIEKRWAKTEKTISLQVLRQYFAGSLKDAAKRIGVCPTTLKRICRRHGITRWPSRKIKKVGHSLKKLQLVIDSVQGAEGSIQLSSFYNNFPELVSTNAPGSSHLQNSTMSGHLQTTNNAQHGAILLSSGTNATSSGSHSSTSSFCCSTGVKQSSFLVNGSSSGDALSAEQTEGGDIMKRTQSDAQLHNLGQEDNKLLVRSYSQKIFSHNASTEAPSIPKSNGNVNDASAFRVKATFGEDKVRLSLQSQWGFKDLQLEVFRRFNIENCSRIDLKYLDDDSEWVLLTCDADLEECIDIHRSSKSRTIKISLNQSDHPSLGSSFGSNSPL